MSGDGDMKPEDRLKSEETFTRFIEEYRDEKEVKYEQAISEMVVKGLNSLIIDFADLYAFDEDVARLVLEYPLVHLPLFDVVAFSKLRMRDPMYADQIRWVHVRFRGLPAETPLSRIGAQHISRLVMVTGVVIGAKAIKPRLITSVFRCKSCGEKILLDQTEQFLILPMECPSCGRKRGFDLITEESVYIDSQQLFVSEVIFSFTSLTELCVEIFDDIVGTAEKRDRVIITGIVGVRHLDKTVEATLYIKGNYLEIEKKAETFELPSHTQVPGLQVELKKILGVIGEMERISGVVQDEDLFTAILEDHGIAKSEAARLIGVLIRDGAIFSPRPGYYKKTM